MSKRVAVGLATLAVLATGSACTPGQTWPISPDVGLGRDSSGQLVLLGNLCSVTLAKIELGQGKNPFDKAQSTLVPTGQETNHFRVDLTHPGPTFQLASGADPSSLGAPIWVRVSAPDGFWATAVFETTPQPGAVLAVPYGSKSGSPESTPLDDYPVGSPDCGRTG
ncbi:MAG: hypothetical protein J0I87_09165 [Cellulomonas sp.]|nr:hypothetical protein [Cellulomonas sp.]